MTTVVKRNGKTVEFDKSKIRVAVQKSMKNGSGIYLPDIARLIANDAEKYFSKMEQTTIPQIEKYVFDRLIHYGQNYTARAYEGYRAIRAEKRENDPLINSVLGLLDFTNEEVMTENANKDATLASTQRDLIAGEVIKVISRDSLIPYHLIQANDDGIIKIHDMDFFAQGIYNCELVNLDDMLQNGTVINRKLIEKPKSLRVATTLATQISAAIAACTYGGQTMTTSHLAPFVRLSKERYEQFYKENLGESLTKEQLDELVMTSLKKEIEESVQAFNYQINTISVNGNQSPFISLVLYISENEEYEEENAMLIEEFLKQRIKGMKNEYGITVSQTFPKLLYFTDENNAYEGSKYFYLTELACKSVAKRLSPDFISVKQMKEKYGAAYGPMGCRAFLTPVQNEDGTYKTYGRGNLGVCTLNLPDIALTSEGDKEVFFEILEHRLNLCKEVGLLRYNKMKNVKAKTAPILWQHGAISRLNPEDSVIKAINDRDFTVSIGYCGLHECALAMTGKSLTSEEGTEFGLAVMNYINDYKDKIKEETGLLFAVYGTPSESTAGWFSEKTKKKFGIIEGITDKGWFTNSYHVDIQENINAFDKLKFENQFAELSLGGTITYVEVHNMEKNIEAVIQLVQYMYENNIYAEINTESDNCSSCSYSGAMEVDRETLKWYCPQCGETDQDKLSVVRRTCGYISETVWCGSRMLDIINRVKHL